MPPSKDVFSLEALEAKHGDALILHCGPKDAPRCIVIDGGPRGVFAGSLQPRLEELRNGGELEIDLLMVSHLDDDHINGVLQFAEHVSDLADQNKSRYRVRELWHNSFDDVIGSAHPATVASMMAAVAAAKDLPASVAPAAAIAASVPQGRQLRQLAAKLKWKVNGGAASKDKLMGAGRKVELSTIPGLELLVTGPNPKRIGELNEKWDEVVKEKGWAAKPSAAEIAAFLDRSVYNLSSIVVLATMGGKRMLLTGDARGDDILDGLKSSGVWDREPYAVDLLKVPHHGSQRNVTQEFFEKVPARHYVVSGDGGHGNPDSPTLDWIVAARGDDDYTIHLTNQTGKKGLTERLEKQLAAFPAKVRKRFRFRAPNDLGIRVDLGAPLA
jgi:beta-lactamase superfamily II metal-dependent hydrolase